MYGMCLLKLVKLWWYVGYIEVESGGESSDEDLQAAIKLSRVGAGARSSQATSNSSSSSSSGEHSNKPKEQDGEEELLGTRPWVARNPEVGSKEYNWNVEQAEKARADALAMSGRSLGQELPSTISPNPIFAKKHHCRPRLEKVKLPRAQQLVCSRPTYMFCLISAIYICLKFLSRKMFEGV